MTRGSVPFYYQNSSDHSLYQGHYLDRTIYAFPIVSSNARGGFQTPAKANNDFLPTNNGGGFPSSPALTSPNKVNSPMNKGVVLKGRIEIGGYITPFKRPPLVSEDTEKECVRRSAINYGELESTGRRLFIEPRNESSPRALPRAVAFSQKPPGFFYIPLGAFRYTPNPLPYLPLYTPRNKNENAKNNDLFLGSDFQGYSGVPQNLALYSGASFLTHVQMPFPVIASQSLVSQNLPLNNGVGFSSPLPASPSKAGTRIDLVSSSYFSPQPNPEAIQPEEQNRQLQPSEEVKITLEEVEKALVFSKNYKPPFYKEVKLEIKKHETIIEKINSFYNKLFNKPDYAKTVEDNKTKALVREYKIADIATKADGSKVTEYIEKLRNPQEDIKKFRHTGEPETNNLYNELNKLEPNFLTKGSFFSPNHNLREKIANALELGLEIKQKNNPELNHLIKAIGMDYYADPKVGQIAKLARMINYNDDALTALSEKGIKKQIIDFASLIILPVVHSPKLINPPLGGYHVVSLPERHYEDGPSSKTHSQEVKNLFPEPSPSNSRG